MGKTIDFESTEACNFISIKPNSTKLMTADISGNYLKVAIHF